MLQPYTSSGFEGDAMNTFFTRAWRLCLCIGHFSSHLFDAQQYTFIIRDQHVHASGASETWHWRSNNVLRTSQPQDPTMSRYYAHDKMYEGECTFYMLHFVKVEELYRFGRRHSSVLQEENSEHILY